MQVYNALSDLRSVVNPILDRFKSPRGLQGPAGMSCARLRFVWIGVALFMCASLIHITHVESAI